MRAAAPGAQAIGRLNPGVEAIRKARCLTRRADTRTVRVTLSYAWTPGWQNDDSLLNAASCSGVGAVRPITRGAPSCWSSTTMSTAAI